MITINDCVVNRRPHLFTGDDPSTDPDYIAMDSWMEAWATKYNLPEECYTLDEDPLIAKAGMEVYGQIVDAVAKHGHRVEYDRQSNPGEGHNPMGDIAVYAWRNHHFIVYLGDFAQSYWAIWGSKEAMQDLLAAAEG